MEFAELVGKTLTKIEVLDERIVLTGNDGNVYASYHMQDCCESVGIEAVIGEPDSVLNSPILEAVEESGQFGEPPQYPDSWTRTTQKIRTANGVVVFSWMGESNGWHGETPYFSLTH